MTTPYNLSTDYAELYRLIQNGQTLVGFVDEDPYSDLIKILRFGSDGIKFIKRGKLYRVEEEEFVATCKSLNLKWIKPD